MGFNSGFKGLKTQICVTRPQCVIMTSTVYFLKQDLMCLVKRYAKRRENGRSGKVVLRIRPPST